jgi:hypothetical protein
MNNDVATAKRECLKTLGQLQSAVKQLANLIRDSDSYDPEPFNLSVRERLPEVVRRMQGTVAWAQILIQLKVDHDEKKRTTASTSDLGGEGQDNPPDKVR